MATRKQPSNEITKADLPLEERLISIPSKDIEALLRHEGMGNRVAVKDVVQLIRELAQKQNPEMFGAARIR